MPAPPGWDATTAIATCPWVAFHGSAWRAHWRGYGALSWEGSLRFSGRYNRGPVEFPEGPTWPALYLAFRPEIPWVEITRHSSVLPLHNEFLLSEVFIGLTAVLDCRDVTAMGLSPSDLLNDTDYEVPQALAGAALARGAKGMVVPSATLLGDNLIILPDNLPMPGDYELRVIGSRAMRPYADRDD